MTVVLDDTPISTIGISRVRHRLVANIKEANLSASAKLQTKCGKFITIDQHSASQKSRKCRKCFNVK